MIIGYDFFSSNFFDANITSSNIYKCELSNCKVDEFKIEIGGSEQYIIDKTDWNENTILQCKFQDLNFEAGNINLAGIPVEYLRVKKRKLGDLSWKNYKDIPFSVNQSEYSWKDYFVEALEDYDYAICPVGSQGVEGEYSINSISCDYEDIYTEGINNVQYRLFANIQKGDIQVVSPSNFVETIGSKYPYEIKNGAIKYRKGTIKATLISDSTLNDNVGINRKSEKKLRNSIYEFFTNGKPKVYKDSDGSYILISIKADSVKLTPDNNISRQIYEISFDFYEVGDVESTETLVNCGLLS
jgi:hypothetical protein